jgi:hypothetical protein
MTTNETLREARDRYFEENGFGPDGGYGDAWVDFHLGPLAAPFPNTAARVRAVRYHDLHHVLTGYRTDLTGEAEISAWELATGCLGMPAAFVLNLGGLTIGLVVAPLRTYRAFARGRRTKNLYGERFDDALLARPADEARRDAGLDDAGPGAPEGAGAFAAFAPLALVAVLATLAMLPLALLVVPIGLLSTLKKSLARA